MPLTASLVIGGLSAVGKAGVGFGQLLHSKKNVPVRPLFDIQDEYFDNRDIAARQAASGLTDASKDYYSDQAGRGLQTTTSAILQAGGGVNAAAGALDSYQQGVRSIAAEDSQLQQKNILAFLERNDAVAKQKTQQWALNKYEPYKDQAKANAQEREAGITNLFGGLSEATGALSSYSTSKNYEDLLDKVGNNNNGNVTVNAPTPTGRTTYYTDKPSEEYGDFVSEWDDPYAVTPLQERKAQVAKELNSIDFNAQGVDPALIEMYKRLSKY